MKKPTKTTKKVKNSLEKKIEELELRITLLEGQRITYIPYYPQPQNYPQKWNPLNPPYTTSQSSLPTH